MSICYCERCCECYDTDYNDGAFADDGTFLCENCCEAEEEDKQQERDREDLEAHEMTSLEYHEEEFQAGVL